MNLQKTTVEVMDMAVVTARKATVRPDISARLDSHELWLRTEKRSGAQAVFRDTIIQHSDAFVGRDLRSVRFENVECSGVKFYDSDLTGVDLSSVKGLLPDQFAGAVLKNTKLPASLDFSGIMGTAGEIAKNAGKLSVSLLIACVYSWVTIASTTDAPFLTDSATSALPLIGVTIPIVTFYWAAPVILLFAYVFFCLQLHRLWVELGSLPAVFVDGLSLDRKAYPSPWTGFIPATFVRLNTNFRFQLQLISGALATWAVTPITLSLFWSKYLRCHDWPVTILHTVALTISLTAGAGFYVFCTNRLKTHEPKAPAATGKRLAVYSALAFVVFLTICIGCFNGAPTAVFTDYGEFDRRKDRLPWSPYSANILCPKAVSWFGIKSAADFTDSDPSAKPAGWVDDGPNALDRIKAAKLDHRNLRFARGMRAFLVRAQLAYSDMYGANLWMADMRESRLQHTNLDNSVLYGADLRKTKLLYATLAGSDLRMAQLQDADLTQSDLREADLSSANCTHTDFTRTKLQGAKFDSANLQAAQFTGADFDASVVKKAHNWALARYRDRPDSQDGAVILKRLGLPEDHNSRVATRDLTGYSLKGADLIQADMSKFDLKGADLTGANLSKANLSDAIGLTVDQLSRAGVDYMTKLPPKITLTQIVEYRRTHTKNP